MSEPLSADELRVWRSAMRGLISHLGDAKRSAEGMLGDPSIPVAVMRNLTQALRALDQAESHAGWASAKLEER